MAKLTSEQQKRKFHKRSSTGRPVCEAYITPEERDRLLKRQWSGVTCKNCLRSKPKT